ncbi:MAG: TusE/DsrC/DsvC family sulfur relay protein [Thermanaeromonas sp.]|uniref:TusE/DsrC/DsvC family sulfur relay protein n=1 Tax=Thermanaeromonas sp. TaxID=2003697 RepID=UPI002439F033|nr:TusE/DsrC/DsvC family sulfur relay protein [Thermanaeromonas sp.]MCG0277716.1 TusE/DsrC/DsvC family sulfur relay protein [Thermanaeromonas sp.]
MGLSQAEREAIMDRARERGIDLGEEHWYLLELSYDYYRKHKTICTLRTLMKLSGWEKKKIYKLFPGNPVGEISKITGLPMPKEC